MTTRTRPRADSLARRLERQRDNALAAARAITDGAGERDLTLAEEARLEQQLADADRIEERLARLNSGPTVQVRSEPLTYRRGGEHSFFADVIRAFRDEGGAAVQERLARHRREMELELERRERRAEAELGQWSAAGDWTVERRDLSRVAGAGGDFVPPLWIADLYAPIARAGRVLAALATNIPLPSGTQEIKIPRVSAGGSVAPQTADNAAVDRVDLVTNSLILPVRTIVGEQIASLQLLEQGSPPGFDVLMYGDLLGDYEDTLGAQLLAGPGTGGTLQGLLGVAGVAVTYTDATATVPELQVRVADGASQAAQARKLPMTAILMAPRRWYWVTAAQDGQGGLLVPPTPEAPAAPEDPAAPVGSMCTVPVYLEPGVPSHLGAGANEDRIVATRPSDHLLFESVPRLRVLNDPLSGTLQTRVQFYRYVAWTAARHPTGAAVVSGTGLATPVFG